MSDATKPIRYCKQKKDQLTSKYVIPFPFYQADGWMVREVAKLQNDFDNWNLLLVLGNFAIPLV